MPNSLWFKSREKHRESEAPAELAKLRFGRSLTLPGNELVGSKTDRFFLKRIAGLHR
jgi:hypothetical protein